MSLGRSGSNDMGKTASYGGPSNPLTGFAKPSGHLHFDRARFGLFRFRDVQIQQPVLEFGLHPALIHLVRQRETPDERPVRPFDSMVFRGLLILLLTALPLNGQDAFF